MSRLMVNVDNKSITYNAFNQLVLKISPDANNGLSIVNGKLTATKAEDGGGGTGGTMNVCGNAIGPETATASDSISIAGMSKNVSRHCKCTDTTKTKYTYIHNNEGVVMTTLTEENDIAENCLAYYMMHNND